MFSQYNIASKSKEILNNALDGPISVKNGEYLIKFDSSQEKDFFALLATANYLRSEIVVDKVTFINNCNINFTNICTVRCGFCAFGKDQDDKDAYVLSDEEIIAKADVAVENGAREFCVMGGVLPDADIHYYEDILKLLKRKYPNVDIYGFSPTMIYNADKKSEVSVNESFKILKNAGLDTLHGTAAEILTECSRKITCPERVSIEEWIDTVKIAHENGILGSPTMRYGHVETLEERVEHLDILRNIQMETGGFTDFIPMTFMHEFSPIFLEGQNNLGAIGTEDLKLYTIARLMFRDLIPNIQVSWVKMGFRFAQVALTAGTNDLGGDIGGDELSEAPEAPDSVDASINDSCNIIENLGRTPIECNSRYSEFYKSSASI